jgi:GTP-binding protein
MTISKAVFVKSSKEIKQLPKPDKPEYAFIGRSNVGKSSLINMLCNNNKLAQTSAKPGKTKLINHFLINDNWYLVDLPGFGYASVSKSSRAEV